MNLLSGLAIIAQFVMPYETKTYINFESGIIVFARVYQGQVIAIDSIKGVEEYFERALLVKSRKLLLEELKKEIVKQGGYANQGLIGTFEIPLPKGGFSEFMGETGKLDVGGYVKITMGGSKTFVANVPGSQPQSLWPELDLKQEMAINLDGEVGDRMRVYIDHNSERIDDTQNKITVTYKGKEDEIIQEIEGGDTQLSIPATTYTGDIPSHKGLFGIKSSARAGPLDLVAIASNEQTSAQELVIEGGIRSDTSSVDDKNYAKRQFFALGLLPGEEVIELKVYVDDNNVLNNNDGITYYGYAYLDTNDDNVPDDTTEYENGYFTLKRQPEDYRLYADIVELPYGLINGQHAMGVYYKKLVNNTDTVVVGRMPSEQDTTVQLKLICPRTMDSSSVTWKIYEQKNYYQITVPGSRLDSLRIYYQPPSGAARDRDSEGRTYNYLLGIDKNQDELPDENYAWLPDRGLLRFPDAQPFISGNLPEPDSEIYADPFYMTEPGKYFIFTKTIEAKPVYDLPENVIGVKVYINDQIQDSTTYNVNYNERKLEFRKPIPPTAQIRIVAEYAPLFSFSQKSLVGVRGSLRTPGDGTLGSSFFYRTEGYPGNEHVGLKEEPFNRMVFETDFALPVILPGVTEAVDWLPLIETETESKLNLNFENAYSFSNLNSEGQVFVDDFEASTISDEVSVNRILWTPASRPVDRSDSNFAYQRLVWYNPVNTDRLLARDIYVDPVDPKELADVLKVIYRPNGPASHAGLTEYVYGKNLEETENLEIIVKGEGGRLHVDIGTWIPEDQLRRNKGGALVGTGTLEDEDRLSPYNSWDQGSEDTGLDGIAGDDGGQVAGDDANDDFDGDDYAGGINGTEGNQIWDTEDIDGNGSLNDKNWYYSYAVGLDGDSTQVSEAIAGLMPGWKMYRVPLKDSLKWDSVFGQPDWRDIKFVRVWFDSFASTETLMIYKLSLNGSRWKNGGIAGPTTVMPDESFKITPVNTKTHPSYYKPPYPVERDPTTNLLKTEGGLELRLENIARSHTCVAYRRTEEYEDYRAYDTLTFYMKSFNRNPLISLRIGADSTNFYEYRTEYIDGISGFNQYRSFKVFLNRFTELKKMRNVGSDTVSDGVYTVCGNPSLSLNRFLEVRLTNTDDTPLSDTLWFNDVRLLTPRREVGQTMRSNGSVNLADLSTFTFAYDRTNGLFKRLSDTKDMSQQGQGENYAVGSDVTLNKLLPGAWNFNIPVNLNYRRSRQYPRFSIVSNDIELNRLDQEKEATTNTGRSYSINFSKSGSKNWLLRQTLDRFTYGHDRSQSFSMSPTSLDTSEVMNHRATYGLDPRVSVRVFGQNVSPLPAATFSAFYSDNFPKTYYRDPYGGDTASYRLSSNVRHRTLNPSLAATYTPHAILNTTYNFSENRDSVLGREDLGQEVGRNQSFTATLTRDLYVLSPTLTVANSYSEDHRFEIRDTFDYRNVSNTSRYGATGSVDLRKIVKALTRIRDETKDSLLVPGSPTWVLKQVEQFVDVILNPTASISRQKNSAYLQAFGRPSAGYQWGLTDSLPRSAYSENSYPGRGVTDNLSVASGFNYRIVNVTGSYSGSVTRTFLPDGRENRIINDDYPNSTVRFSRVEALPFLKKYAQYSSVSTGFNQILEYRYADTLLESDSKTMSLTPLLDWQATWLKGVSSTVNVNYSKTDGRQYDAGYVNRSRSVNRGGSVTLGYTFSAPKGINLPFMQNVRFNSNLTTNLNMSYNRSTSYAIDMDTPTSNSSILSTNIGLSYNFSSSVTGGANFDYSQNKESVINQDSKRVGLSVWTNISF